MSKVGTEFVYTPPQNFIQRGVGEVTKTRNLACSYTFDSYNNTITILTHDNC